MNGYNEDIAKSILNESVNDQHFSRGYIAGEKIIDTTTGETVTVTDYDGYILTVRYENGDTASFDSDWAFAEIEQEPEQKPVDPIKEDDEDGPKYNILFDEIFDGKRMVVVEAEPDLTYDSPEAKKEDFPNDYGYAFEGMVAFPDDYPNFKWGFKSLEEAKEEAEKEIKCLNEIEKNKEIIVSTFGDDFEVESFGCGAFTVRGEGVCELGDIAEKEAKLKEIFGDHVTVKCVKSDKGGFVVVDLSEKKINEEASEENKQAAELLNDIADNMEKDGEEKEDVEAIRNAAKVMSEAVEGCDPEAIKQGLINYFKNKFDADVDVEFDGEGFSVSGISTEEIDLGIIKKELPVECGCQTEVEVFAEGGIIYVEFKGVEMKKAKEEPEPELNESAIKVNKITEFYYAFVLPDYVVRQFGKDKIVNQSKYSYLFEELPDGKVGVACKIANDKDMQMFFGDRFQFIKDDNLADIKMAIESINSEAEEKLDVELDTVAEDIEIAWYAI